MAHGRMLATAVSLLTVAAVVTAAAVVPGASIAASAPERSPDMSSQVAGHPRGGHGAQAAVTLDTRLIRSLKSKDHTTAVKKIRIRLVSSPSKTVWTSTSRTVDVPMQFEITDPERVAKRIRICTELILTDDYWCKSHELSNYRKPKGDFWMRKTKGGWDVYTAPYYKTRSPFECSNHEFYRPKVRWWVRVVDPRNGDDLVSARFGWTVRCSG